MNKIKLELMRKALIPELKDTYYFSDAGDVKIIPSDCGSWISIHNSKGDRIFEDGTVHYTVVFGYTDVCNPNRTQFELPIDSWSEVGGILCFDPRVVMASILVDILGEIHGADDNAWVEQVQEAINPVPTIEEAKVFFETE